MKKKVKFVFLVLISVVIYFLGCILSSFAIMNRFVIGNIELFLVGCVSLVIISFLWLIKLRQYKFFRKMSGILIVFVLGALVSILLSIVYINIRTKAYTEDPGDLGRAALVLIIYFSLFSQTFGFILGYIPMAIFMYKENQGNEFNKVQTAK